MGSGEWEVKDGSKSWTHGKLETHESNSPITTKKRQKKYNLESNSHNS